MFAFCVSALQEMQVFNDEKRHFCLFSLLSMPPKKVKNAHEPGGRQYEKKKSLNKRKGGRGGGGGGGGGPRGMSNAEKRAEDRGV